MDPLTWFDRAFAGQRAMAILRGYSIGKSLELTRQAWSLGIDLVEVPIQSDAAVETLAALVEEATAEGKFIGAGTIDRPERVRQAKEAGAVFTVAPGFDPEVAAASLDAGLPHLPGVATGSEIQAARKFGLNWLKAFPASVLGVEWFQAMKGPFPDLNLVATGGIDASNAGEFLAAGVKVVALGSSLADPAALDKLSGILTTS